MNQLLELLTKKIVRVDRVNDHGNSLLPSLVDRFLLSESLVRAFLHLKWYVYETNTDCSIFLGYNRELR